MYSWGGMQYRGDAITKSTAPAGIADRLLD